MGSRLTEDTERFQRVCIIHNPGEGRRQRKCVLRTFTNLNILCMCGGRVFSLGKEFVWWGRHNKTARPTKKPHEKTPQQRT